MSTRRFFSKFGILALLGLGMNDYSQLQGQGQGQQERRVRYRNTFRARAGEAINKLKRNRKRNKAARKSRVYNLRHA